MHAKRPDVVLLARLTAVLRRQSRQEPFDTRALVTTGTSPAWDIPPPPQG